MEEIIIYLLMVPTEIVRLKAKDSDTVATPLCLGKISKKFSVDIWKRLD